MPRQSAESRAAAAFQAGGAPPEPSSRPLKPTWLASRAAELFEEIAGFATWLTVADSDKLAAWCARHAEYEQSGKGASWPASARSDHRAAASELGIS
ncbi:MAG TPA: hypothetical protein VHW95_00050 [Steroidobacteraceae bacterium]|jgi:hypothetical protein|nr:hypothetical protein [Steroidobacteraceae bacterium]